MINQEQTNTTATLKVATKKAQIGRKPQYTKWLKPDNLIKLEEWAKEGLTIAQLADHKIGVNERTLRKWMVDYPPIGQAIKKGRIFCVEEVENALFKAATGYEVTEEQTETTTMPNGDTITRKRITIKHIPPNTGAAIFYLKNRAPDRWKSDTALATIAARDELGENGGVASIIINYDYGLMVEESPKVDDAV